MIRMFIDDEQYEISFLRAPRDIGIGGFEVPEQEIGVAWVRLGLYGPDSPLIESGDQGVGQPCGAHEAIHDCHSLRRLCVARRVPEVGERRSDIRVSLIWFQLGQLLSVLG